MGSALESAAEGGERRPSAIPTPASARARALVLLGLAIAFLPTWAPPALRAAGLEPSWGIDGPLSSVVWNIVAVALLLTHVLRVERRPLRSLGIARPTGKDLEWALILFGCHMGWTWLARTIWPPVADEGTATIAALHVAGVLTLIASAAVLEEILYRGYPLERLTELTGRRWLALVLTVPVFVAPHLVFFSPDWLLYQGSGTLALYVLFIWRRNLVACMLLHLAINLPILIPTLASQG